LGGKLRPLYIDEISSRLHVAAKFDEILSLRALHSRLRAWCERLVEFSTRFFKFKNASDLNLRTPLRYDGFTSAN